MKSGESLWHFEWQVDQHGYELVDMEKSEPDRTAVRMGDRTITLVGWGWPDGIRRKGGPLRAYRPLEDQPGLFRRFVNLDSWEEILEFANEFGLLHMPGGNRKRIIYDQEPIHNWVANIAAMRAIVRKIDEGERDEACDLFNGQIPNYGSWPMRAVTPDPDDSWSSLIDEEPVPGQELGPFWEEFGRAPQMGIRIAFGDKGRPSLRFVPQTLLQAMWLQISLELTEGTPFRKCQICPNWFPMGSGTGHRRTKVFCSDRCRVAWNRRKRKESENEG